jgi:hypothetical protein
MEPAMTADFPTLTVPAPVRSRKHLTVASLLAFLTLGLMAAFPSHALDLVAFVGIGGPLAAALGQLAALAPGVKALVGFVGFVVAFISLAALRNFGPVLFYLGMAIFGAVGLTIAGAILGAVI